MNIEELMNDQELAQRIEDAGSLEEVVEIYREKGVEVTVEELDCMLKKSESGEMGENDLEEVAGGRIILRPRPIPLPFWPPRRPGWPWRR